MADPTEPPAPPVNPPAPPAPPPAPAHVDPEPDAKAWSKLNREKASHLARANEAEQKLAAIQAERDRLAEEKAALEAAKTAAETEAGKLRGTLKATATKASLRVAAIQAGIVDLDALKLLDASALETDDAGELKDGAAVMAKLKAEKPYLFGQAPAPKQPSTSNPTQPPAPAKPSKKPALDMTDAEFDAAVKSGAWRSK